jgi:phosphoenolpyruvate carboxylase
MSAATDTHLDHAFRLLLDMLQGRARLDDIEQRIAAARVRAVRARADGLRAQFTHADTDAYARELDALLRQLAHADGALLDFEDFAAILDAELAGVVITAHPTFSLSGPAAQLTRELVAGPAGDAPSADAAQPMTIHRRDAPTLEQELDAANRAIRHIRAALRRVLGIAVDTTAELYPDRYRRLKPRLATVATWVGFDLDGRSDIGWHKSLSFRYQLALSGITELEQRLAAIRAARAEWPPDADAALETIGARLSTLRECFAAGADVLAREAENSTRLGRLNRVALSDRQLKHDAAADIDTALDRLTRAELSDDVAKALLVFRAEWETCGLGLARLHFRLNSVQLHNAVRPEISLRRAPGQSMSRRHYLAEVSRLLDGVEAANVHYGTVAREQTTAKRIFMLAAEFAKHFDDRVPVRLLIAESDTPFTLLVALYYARRFGVDTRLEISPLFETADGLHHGDRVISELLDNAHFVAYLRGHGRFCVQLGFSDSGRYIGQPAASLAIERFKLRLVRLFKARGLEDIQLLFFDTHGESVGRGAHPAGLAHRFAYIHPPEVRYQLGHLTAPHKHEVSFQGGEGYLWFASDETAFAVVAELVKARLEPTGRSIDALYRHSAWGLDFFLTLKEYQERLTAHPGYLELINAIGIEMLYPTGSRAMQRAGRGGAAARVDDLSGLRAIPNNAVLHQLAYLLNSCAGLGHATIQAPEAFQSVLEHSARLQSVVSLALAARERSDITVLDAYVRLMDAGYWLDRTDQTGDREWNRSLRRLSRMLEHAFNHDAMAALTRELRRDAARLDHVLEQSHVSGAWSADEALLELHVLRLALIHLIYVKAMEIPEFSSLFEVSLSTLVERLLHLDVPETIATLRRIFPAAVAVDDTDTYGETDTYTQSGPSGYAAEHTEIFDPIERAHDLILELSALIALHVGAYG